MSGTYSTDVVINLIETEGKYIETVVNCRAAHVGCVAALAC